MTSPFPTMNISQFCKQALLSGRTRSWLAGAMFTTLFAASLASSPVAVAQVEVPQQTIVLQDGVVTTLKGRLRGPDKATRDFVVHVRQGATLSVSLNASKPTSTYFNILPPGSEEALFVGEMQDKTEWQQQVTASGDYTVRVYLNRAVARRGTKSDYTLKISAS
ncbi:hypothetical protein D3C72_145970 [compost metagenome]